jgi:crotonobetainyl-CoA:carnitine CoA-transferase CaiB-like acyl-CoA transferase
MHLQGVRVVYLTRILSGPFCTLLSLDYSAPEITVLSQDEVPVYAS